jgi:hypothetical protein
LFDDPLTRLPVAPSIDENLYMISPESSQVFVDECELLSVPSFDPPAQQTPKDPFDWKLVSFGAYNFINKPEQETYFLLDEYSSVCLSAISTVAKIASLTQLKDGVFDKHRWFTAVIAPSLEGEDCCGCARPVDDVLNHDSRSPVTAALDICPRHCLELLFSGLSTRVHFSVFLRLVLPILAPHLLPFLKLPLFRSQLFFYDKEDMSHARASQVLCTELARYVFGAALVEDNRDTIAFFSRVCDLPEEGLIKQNRPHVASFYLIATSSRVSAN